MASAFAGFWVWGVGVVVLPLLPTILTGNAARLPLLPALLPLILLVLVVVGVVLVLVGVLAAQDLLVIVLVGAVVVFFEVVLLIILLCVMNHELHLEPVLGIQGLLHEVLRV